MSKCKRTCRVITRYIKITNKHLHITRRINIFLHFLSSQLALLEAFDEMEDSLTDSSTWFTRHSTSCTYLCKAFSTDNIASNVVFTGLDVSSSDDSSGSRYAGCTLPRCLPIERCDITCEGVLVTGSVAPCCQ